MGKDTTMKVDERLNTLLAIIVGEQQAETGEHRIAAKDAMWEFVKKHRPDLTARADRLLAESKRKRTNGESTE